MSFIEKYWIDVVALLAALSMLLWLRPVFGSAPNNVRVSMSVVRYPVVTKATWDVSTNQVVAGYNIFLNGIKYIVNGRTNNSLTVSNFSGPGIIAATAQTFDASGNTSSNCDEVDAVLPVKTLSVSCTSTNYILQRAPELKSGSWISTGSLQTNNGAIMYFRATESWP